jgi:hypothetical protein
MCEKLKFMAIRLHVFSMKETREIVICNNQTLSKIGQIILPSLPSFVTDISCGLTISSH